ncbi:hypothetical protein FGE12_27990 [Aggregicoccus sp. 17bor-14]|uniref:hypothetical protein n=1 Tax=Myxococcaceae TaxID=31 RepID=UPI00129C2531|nr:MULTISPECIES: hypothetical protein [Myxococcaceae]MBF5046290.1 hypothetical protein [Simulacricoccus sp. 17bor-14]MRI92012.1 hypothetical protein [Aggregicoccus sp. 17bor-14]
MLKTSQPPSTHATPDLPLAPTPHTPSSPPAKAPAAQEAVRGPGHDVDWARMLIAGVLCALVVAGAVLFEVLS